MREPNSGRGRRGPRPGVKFTPEQRAFVGRVFNRLRMKPVYMRLNTMAEVWGISERWALEISNAARGIA